MPSELSDVLDQELVFFLKHLQSLKRERQREIDHIDTEIIGIKEEVRKRKEKEQVARIFQNAFTED